MDEYRNNGFTDIVITATNETAAAWTFVKDLMDATQSESLDDYEDNLADCMNGKGLQSVGAGKDKIINFSDIEGANYLYIKIHGKTADVSPQKIIFRKAVEVKSVIPDVSNIGIGLTHLTPDNVGQLNAVRRMRKLTDVKWMPAFDLARASSGGGETFFHDVFKAGTTYQGVPYSRATYNKWGYGYNTLGQDTDAGFKLGLTISFETFITALYNKGTVMQLGSNFDRENHNSAFYANICAGAACAALGLPYIKTNSFDPDPNQQSVSNVTIKVDGITSVFTCVGRIGNSFNLKLLKLADIMAKHDVHTVVITDVIINDEGIVEHVEVGELTTQGNANYNELGGVLGGVGRRLWWSAKDFKENFVKYKVLRYEGISEVPYIYSPYAPMSDEHAGNAPYTMACLPYMGEGFRYVADAYYINNILKVVVTVKGEGSGADKVYAKKKLSITRYVEGEDPVEFIEDIPTFGENDEYVYVLLNDNKYKVIGSYEAFAFVEREWDSDKGEYVYYCSQDQTSTSTGKTKPCHWSVVDEITYLEDF